MDLVVKNLQIFFFFIKQKKKVNMFLTIKLHYIGKKKLCITKCCQRWKHKKKLGRVKKKALYGTQNKRREKTLENKTPLAICVYMQRFTVFFRFLSSLKHSYIQYILYPSTNEYRDFLFFFNKDSFLVCLQFFLS